MNEEHGMTVTKNVEQGRYELLSDEEVLSYATYTQADAVVSIPLVFTPPEFRGDGNAARLMAGIVTLTDEAGEEINPICPYAVTYLNRNRPTGS